MTATDAPLAPELGARLARFAASCISTPANIVLSLTVMLALGWTLPGLLDWAVVEARWSGVTPDRCSGADAACWTFVKARLGQLVYGPYPVSERWRVNLVFALVLSGAAALLSKRIKRKGLTGFLLIAAAPPLSGLLLLGGRLGLAPVPTTLWGGLMLTVVLAGATIAGALPVGLLLALGRRSPLPVIRALSIAVIEFWRGVPLIAILFMAMSVVPLLVPPGTELPPFLRALIAFILFNGAGMAEVFRGGLQAIPKGQFEAARSLGLGPARTMVLIVLPQAIGIVMPGLLNVAVAIVKETTVVLIIGLLDFLAQIEAGLADPQWIIGDQVRDTAYLFAGLVFWAVCFGLSRVSARLELRGERRS